MRKSILSTLTLCLALGGSLAGATTLSCTNPTLESVRLLCKANEIKSRRVQTALGGALVGALLGNILAQQSGGSRTDATIAGAVAGGLTGYWLNLQNEIAAKNASQSARAAEVKAQASAEAKRQRVSATNLHTELRTVLLKSPAVSTDPIKREAQIAQIAAAANVGVAQAQQSAQGYTKVGDGLGTPVNGNSLFASTANDFGKTRQEACAQLTRPIPSCAS